MANYGITNDIKFDHLDILKAANICGVKIGAPNHNATSSKIYNDTTYNSVDILNTLSLCGAFINNEVTNEEYDAYRQQAMRIENANEARTTVNQNTLWPSNDDESTIPKYIGNFTKGMSHDSTGRINDNGYVLLRDGMSNRDVDKISSIPLAGSRKFVQPLAGFNLNSVGTPPSSIPLPAAPSISSAQAAGELVECYCQALCRDVPFVDYGSDPKVNNCVIYLSSLSDYKGIKPITSSNIFRGIGIGVDVGPYISQLFYMDTLDWPYTLSAKVDFPTRSAINDRMITKTNYLSVQNGNIPENGPTLLGSETYLSTGRDMSYLIWKDSPGKCFERAAIHAIDAGCPFSSSNPYINNPIQANQEQFITWNLCDIRSCMFMVIQNALSAAWYGKWMINRRLRPEAMANEVVQYKSTNTNIAKLHSDLLNSGVLNDIFALNGTYYLPQAFPEGSPMHPSYPQGHSTLSGACITILKAFLDDTWVFPNPVVPNSAGTLLEPITDTLTLSGELNKLASNIALGRDFAGVHYRSDAHEGILLGEMIAIEVLQNWINRYPETNLVNGNVEDVSFNFTSYMGTPVTITQQFAFGTNIQNI